MIMSKIKNPLQDLRNSKIREHPTTLDVVSALMNTDNIVMKTEISNPYALDTLKLYGTHLQNHGQELAGNLILEWIEILLEYMVSNKRASRKEITEILKGYFTLEREKEQKIGLTSNLANLKTKQEF